MSTELTDVTVKQVLEQALTLNQKERSKIIKDLLKSLGLGQLNEVKSVLEREIEDAILEEEEKAKTEYKYINGAFYAYVRQWGKERVNIYLGRMPFLPGFKYKLTHKKQNQVEIVVGLGLERKKERLFLNILYLLPLRKVVSYLFYDKSLVLPRTPGEELLLTTFSLKEWEIEYLGQAESQELGNEFVEYLPITFIAKVDTVRQSQVDGDKVKNPSKVSLNNSGTLPIEIIVEKNLSSKISFLLKQWTKLSHILPSSPQLEVVHKYNKILLLEPNEKELVEYNSKSYTLKIYSVNRLKNLLREITTNIVSSNSPLVKKEEREEAGCWLSRIKTASRQESKEQFLAQLFYL